MGCAGFAALAGAQTLPPGGVPQAIQPGRVLQQSVPTPSLGGGGGEVNLPGPERGAMPAGAQKLHFRLRDVRLVGATVYPAGTFTPIYGKDVGKTISLADVYGWADTITARYRADGYILSQVVVPAQRIRGGVVQLVVVEGFIDKVRIQGASSALLVAYGDKIRASRPLTSKVLERYLLLMNDLPGMSVQSVLAPSPNVPGAADLTLVTRRKSVDGSVEMDNFASVYQGPWEATASADFNDLFKHDERLALRYTTSSTPSEMGLFGLNLALPLDDDGTSLITDASRTRGHPGYTLTPFDARTIGDALSFEVQHPLIRSRPQTLLVTGTFSYLDSTTRLNVPGSSDDKIRALRVGASYTSSDSHGGQNALSTELSEGLPILDSSSQGSSLPSRKGGRIDFTKVTLNGSRLQALGHNFGLLGAFTAQTSFGERLLSSEQFGVGGPVFGRGYDPSEITGDSGVAGKLEVQKNLLFACFGSTCLAQWFGFYDLGVVFSEPAVSGGSGTGRETLASTGTGVRFNLPHGLVPMVEVAQPLTRPVASEVGDESDPKGVRIYFSLAASF